MVNAVLSLLAKTRKMNVLARAMDPARAQRQCFSPMAVRAPAACNATQGIV